MWFPYTPLAFCSLGIPEKTIWPILLVTNYIYILKISRIPNQPMTWPPIQPRWKSGRSRAGLILSAITWWSMATCSEPRMSQLWTNTRVHWWAKLKLISQSSLEIHSLQLSSCIGAPIWLRCFDCYLASHWPLLLCHGAFNEWYSIFACVKLTWILVNETRTYMSGFDKGDWAHGYVDSGFLIDPIAPKYLSQITITFGWSTIPLNFSFN